MKKFNIDVFLIKNFYYENIYAYTRNQKITKELIFFIIAKYLFFFVLILNLISVVQSTLPMALVILDSSMERTRTITHTPSDEATSPYLMSVDHIFVFVSKYKMYAKICI